MGSAFDLLGREVRSVVEEAGWGAPTAPQEAAMQVLLDGKHCLLLAPTGHGKTEAALLPIFQTFTKARNDYRSTGKAFPAGIKILYVTPLRALNRDMLARIKHWGERLSISVAVRHGDTTTSERQRQSRDPPDLLITTPETVQVLFTGSRLREHLKTVRWVVVDEVHELAEGERGAQFSVALERLERVVEEGRRQRTETGYIPREAVKVPPNMLSGFQRIGLSATVGSPKDVAHYLGGEGRDVEVLNVTAAKQYDIRVELVSTERTDWSLGKRLGCDPRGAALVRRLKEVIDAHRSVLVFSNTRDGAEMISARLRVLDEALPVGVHHGSLSRDVRIQMEEAYKTGQLKAMVCTSSLELGIDIGQTDLAVQHNSPRGIGRMRQRAGRAGHRATEISRGLVLCDSEEEFAEALVVARRAMRGELPPTEIRPSPTSVLANQIVATVMEYNEVGFDWMFHVVRQTAPLRGLTLQRFEQVARQLDGQRTVGVDFEKRVFWRRPRSRDYFLDNISMIPDERTFPVVDATTRTALGTLDESFVLSSCQPAQVFIMRGRPWTVVEVNDERVLVAPARELGNVPSWTGEDLPVPFEVAQEVGAVRRRLQEGEDPESIAREYACVPEQFEPIRKLIEQQRAKKLAVPSDKTVTVEVGKDTVIVNTCWGSRVNETFARLLGALLAQRTGASVAISSDAYRLVVGTPEEMPASVVVDTLKETPPHGLDALLRASLKRSTYIRWQLIHVARKFGALSRQVDPSKFSMRRLLELFEQMPLFDEALEKVLWERMDVRRGTLVLERIQKGEVRLVVQAISPIGLHGLDAKRELMIPARADKAILEALARRLEETNVILACLHCGSQRSRRTGDLKDLARAKFACHVCDSRMVAALGPFEATRAKLIKKKARAPEEEREVRRLWKNAELVNSFGYPAVVALAGRGVGPETAGKVLGKGVSESEFYKAILEAELQYARTRSFWQ